MENFLNAMSEHEGVKCVLHAKPPIKHPESRDVRDFSMATFNIMQPMVDTNRNLQSLFCDKNPEMIADKLVKDLKEITDVVIIKK